MQGNFSEESLIKYNELLVELQGLSYSETDSESYDFTRCVRKDGSVYGTKGKCRKGTEATKAAAERVAERASKLARKRKNQNPERKALYERLKKLASERANPSKNKKDRDLLTPAERERRRGRFDWEGEGSVTKSGKKRRKQEALGEHPKKGMPHQVWEAIDMLREHPVLKKYVDPNASYDDAYATIPVRHLKKHLGWGEKELKVISKRTDPYEGDIHIEDGKATFYGGA